jgi:hypothetical protein
MSTTPAVMPAPPSLVGLRLFLDPEPQIGKLEAPEGRPIAMSLVHGVRDALEEAGFKLAPSADAASGMVITVRVERIAIIESDLFIKGGQACGVVVELRRGPALVATTQPEVECLSTSSYYGMLPKDAAVVMVNKLAQSPGLVSAAGGLTHDSGTAVDASERQHEE